MDVAITGSSGLIGAALADHLDALGHRPVSVVRRRPRPGADEIRWDPTRGEIDAASLEGIGAVVHLAGAGIGNRRWNAPYREELVSSRVTSTALLASTLAGLDQSPACFLSGSAIGFYGNRGPAILDEESEAGHGFLAELVTRWEAAAAPAAEAGVPTMALRSGLVLDAHGGVLPRLLRLFRMGLGGRLGRGRQWVSWITLDDEVAAITFLIEAGTARPPQGVEPVNLTAPHPVTNADLTRVLRRAARRPAMPPIPPFGPKLVLGREMAQSLLFDSQRVVPRALDEAGYRFAHPELPSALDHVLTPLRRLTP